MADLSVWQRTIVDEEGNVIPGAEIEVRREEDGGLATLYADRAGETPLANPLAADTSGFVRFFVQGGAYTITAVGAGSTRTWRFDPTGRLQEFDRVSDALAVDDGADTAEARSLLGTFSTVADVENSRIPAVLDSIRTNGYYDPGDGGGALYKRAESEPSHNSKVQSADGSWWTPVVPAGYAFDSVADMKASRLVTPGARVRTLGYYSPGDGGGNDYEIVAAGTGTDDGGSFVDLSGSGLQAKGLFVDGVVNVKEFGARGDGVSDAASAINNCISFLSAAGGGVAYVPAGDYVVGSTIVMRSNTTLEGDGTTSRILSSATDKNDVITNESADLLDTNEFNPDDESIHIRNLYVNGNGRNRPGGQPRASAIRLKNCKSSSVTGCYVENASWYGIEIKACWDIDVTGNLVTDCGDDGISVTDTDLGVSLTRRVRVLNNTAWNCVADPDLGAGVQVGSGIEIDDGPKDCLVSGNVCYGNRIGIEVHRHAGYPIVENINIIGNHCFDNEWWQMRVSDIGGGNLAGKGIKITENVLEGRNSTSGGIHFKNVDRSQFSSNRVSHIAPEDPFRMAIRIEGSRFSEVAANTVNDIDLVSAIFVIDSNTIVIRDNDMRAIGAHGIRLYDSTAERTFVFDNQISAAGGERFIDNGASTRKRWTEEINGQLLSYDIDGSLNIKAKITLSRAAPNFLSNVLTYESHYGKGFVSVDGAQITEAAGSISNYTGNNSHILGARVYNAGLSSTEARIYRMVGGDDFDADTTMDAYIEVYGRYTGGYQP